MNRTHGYTLLELLVVIAVIGILAGIGFSVLSGARARAVVRDTAQQITADLNRARSSAQRSNQDASLVLAGDGKSYALTLAGADTTFTLPSGLTVQSVNTDPAETTATYTAPYGELSGSTGRLWKVSSAAATVYVKTVGVTGKANVYAN